MPCSIPPSPSLVQPCAGAGDALYTIPARRPWSRGLRRYGRQLSNPNPCPDHLASMGKAMLDVLQVLRCYNHLSGSKTDLVDVLGIQPAMIVSRKSPGSARLVTLCGAARLQFSMTGAACDVVQHEPTWAYRCRTAALILQSPWLRGKGRCLT